MAFTAQQHGIFLFHTAGGVGFPGTATAVLEITTTGCCALLAVQVVLAEYGVGAVALYYLAPLLLGSFFGSLRGFAGEVTAAQALDMVGSDGSTVIIDIRSEVCEPEKLPLTTS